jgi:hypothetical protein
MGGLGLQGVLAEFDCECEGLSTRRNGAVGVPRDPAYKGHPGQHQSQPAPVVARPGQRLGLAQQGEAPPILSECGQRDAQREAELDGLSPGVAGLRQVLESLEGLLKGGHGLAEGGAVPGPGASVVAVGHGFVPHLAPEGVVGQPVDLLGHPLPGERLHGLDNQGMQRPPSLQQETPIGHLMRQGVLEGVFQLGEEARLVEELRGLQAGQALVDGGLGHLRDGLQECCRDVLANNGRRLEEVFVFRRQPVDPRREHRLHRRWHPQR